MIVVDDSLEKGDNKSGKCNTKYRGRRIERSKLPPQKGRQDLGVTKKRAPQSPFKSVHGALVQRGGALKDQTRACREEEIS